MKFRSAPYGFTLVELLITVSIITIMSAAVIPSFSGYIRNQNVRQAQEQVKSDLRSVQNKALTGALSDQTVGGADVAYWGVKFTQNSNRYEYFIASVATSCPGSFASGQLQGWGEVADSLDMKNGGCVFFSMADGSITTPVAMTSVIVGFVGSTASGSCRRVEFHSNGIIFSNTVTSCT